MLCDDGDEMHVLSACGINDAWDRVAASRPSPEVDWKAPRQAMTRLEASSKASARFAGARKGPGTPVYKVKLKTPALEVAGYARLSPAASLFDLHTPGR